MKSWLILLTLAVVAPGCSLCSSTPHRSAERTTRFSAEGISFDYPARWRFHRPGFETTISSGLVDLSTQPMHDPCRTISSDETECSWPVTRLRPGGVVVRVTEWGMPGETLHGPGRQVRIHIAQPGHCRVIAGTQSIEELFKLPRGYLIKVDGCVRAPGLVRSTQEIESMAASMRLAGGG